MRTLIVITILQNAINSFQGSQIYNLINVQNIKEALRFELNFSQKLLTRIDEQSNEIKYIRDKDAKARRINELEDMLEQYGELIKEMQVNQSSQ